MDFTGDGAFSPTDTASIALLRHLRAGGDDVHFVHRVDVCDAPPEVLVADLEPVPGTGTGIDDDGYSSVWYFYQAKKFTNKQGRLSGHRQRKVTGGGGASWHSEISPKEVQGSGGGTSCTLSYGHKTNPSARSIDRMGWCMKEYDFADADKKEHEAAAAAAASNYVLCKVYRSPRAEGKPASASASSYCKNASSKQTAKKKRKAGGGDHPEAPPAKSASASSIQQVQHETTCYQPQDVEYWEHGGDFNYNIEDLNFYVDESMLRDEPVPEPGLQQATIACGPVLAAEACTTGDNEEEFTVEWLLRGEPQPPIVETPLGHGHGHGGGEFIQMPWGQVVPVVPETTVEDMLGLGMTTTSIPTWSSYTPAVSSSSYAGCSSLLQGPDPLRLPYLAC